MHNDRVVVSKPQCRHHRCRVQVMSARAAGHLENMILRSVSRSFYLSIRFLPAQLRQPIALAYLLARATDTIADTTGISGLMRIETLKMLSNGIQGKASRDVVVDLIASFIPLQVNKNEQRLLESLPDCLDWLDQIEQADRNDIRIVLGKITRGQMLDLRSEEHTSELQSQSNLV